MRSARLLLDPPASGSWNMAVDQALLESVGKTGEMVLRFYRWEVPTLSLGYFQCLQERNSHQASQGCPVVRRSTGGGAIVHDQEITYSLCVPSCNRWAEEHEQLYWTVHRCIIDVLSEWGVAATMFRLADVEREDKLSNPFPNQPSVERSHVNAQNSKSFLCFQRRMKGDITCGLEKICGSAQRRNQNSILQHGSIIFGRSSFAPELPGIDELSRQPPIAQAKYLQRVIQRIGEVLEVDLIASNLKAEEQSRALGLELHYRSTAWLNKKGGYKRP